LLKSVLCAIALLLVPAASANAAGEFPVGEFSVTGTNPGDNSAYSGSVVVSKTGHTYHVVWDIDGEHYEGTAVGGSDFLAVSYSIGGDTGIALYTFAPPVWRGVWTYTGGDQTGTEIWERR